LVNYMPFKELAPIGTESNPPTWQAVNDAVTKLASNARSVPSDCGDGLLGHCFIIIGSDRYKAISLNGVNFVPPPAPTLGPVLANNHPSYAQIEEAKRIHRVSKWDYQVYHLVEDILKRMLLAAIHKNYKQQFWTDDFQYVCTLSTLLTSLDKYRVKTSKELADNKVNMLKPWEATTETIHAFLGHIQDGRRFDPSIPDGTCVRETVDIICANIGFGTVYETWCAKVATDKPGTTWLVQHFIDADHMHIAKMALRPPPQAATYPGSANSATTPGTAITTPPTESEMLCKAMAAMTKAMNKLTTSAPTMASSSTMTTSTYTHPPRRGNPTGGGRIPTVAEAASMTYCWSHGFCIQACEGQEDHTSGTCNCPNLGHKPDATAANKMGGECRICNSWKPNWHMPNGE
jgi:hypothetical protein